MKRVIAGGFFLFSGIILYLGIHLSASIFMPNLSGWSTPPGRFGSALRETGGNIATVFAIILCVLGFFILIYECYLKDIIDTYKNDYEKK